MVLAVQVTFRPAILFALELNRFVDVKVLAKDLQSSRGEKAEQDDEKPGSMHLERYQGEGATSWRGAR